MPSNKALRKASKASKQESTPKSGTNQARYEQISSNEADASSSSDSNTEPKKSVPLRDLVNQEDQLPHFPEPHRKEQEPILNIGRSIPDEDHRLETIQSTSESSSVSLPTYSMSNLRDTLQPHNDQEDPESSDHPLSTSVQTPRSSKTKQSPGALARWITGQPRPKPQRQTSLPPLELPDSNPKSPQRSPRNTRHAETQSTSSSSSSHTPYTRRPTDLQSDTSTLSAFSGPPTRRSSTSSNKSVRFEEVSTLQHAGKSSLKKTQSPFEILIKELNLDRVFYDPELDVLNRFCLEYVDLSKLTLNKHWSLIRSEPHFTRVYKYMKEQTEDQGTPAVASPPPISKPVVHFGLFLDHFRASSSRIFDPKVPLPHFSHGHRLNEQRFQKIVEGIFTRRSFLGSSVGVSAEKLSDLS
uniref:Uncharacterized protein n=1 Tax=Lichen partiti-like RNA virus sp. TaxID=2726938 RepID=A0A6J4CUT0_9VIRU|nr:hypothetical protein [Lichen partiti-like RNA virus sp.]